MKKVIEICRRCGSEAAVSGSSHLCSKCRARETTLLLYDHAKKVTLDKYKGHGGFLDDTKEDDCFFFTDLQELKDEQPEVQWVWAAKQRKPDWIIDSLIDCLHENWTDDEGGQLVLMPAQVRAFRQAITDWGTKNLPVVYDPDYSTVVLLPSADDSEDD